MKNRKYLSPAILIIVFAFLSSSNLVVVQNQSGFLIPTTVYEGRKNSNVKLISLVFSSGFKNTAIEIWNSKKCIYKGVISTDNRIGLAKDLDIKGGLNGKPIIIVVNSKIYLLKGYVGYESLYISYDEAKLKILVSNEVYYFK